MLPTFRARTLDVDTITAKLWGEMRGQALRQGQPLTMVDSLLAATARAHGLIVVTRNVQDFRMMGVEVFNPWASGR